jgi:uncharacterized protein YjdB
MKTDLKGNKWNITTLAVIVWVACVSCTEERLGGGATVEVQQITINTPSVVLNIDETQTLDYLVLPVEAANQKLTWSSSDDAIVTVNQNGRVTAAGIGTATITVRAPNGKLATCTVTVEEEQTPTVVEVTEITLDKPTLTLVIDTYATLNPTVKPANATDKTVTWESDRTQVATVDNQGSVTAVTLGEARITARSGAFTATCEVTVTPESILATEIKLDKKILSLFEGGEIPDEAFLSVTTLTPENTTDIITWSSLNVQITTVEGAHKEGKVTAVGLGTTDVVVKAGDATDTCRVTVLPVTEMVTSITLNKAAQTLTEGDDFDLTATIITADGSEEMAMWTSSDPTVATVPERGNVVTVNTLKVGETTITARAGNKTATCKVTVRALYIDVTNITVAPQKFDRLVVGDELRLNVTIAPENATNKEVEWKSRNEDIATVNGNGQVTAHDPGTVMVVAISKDNPTIKDSCEITVVEETVSDVREVRIYPSELRLMVGESAEVTFEVTPEDAEIFSVKWDIMKEDYLTVTPKNGPASKTATVKAIRLDEGEREKTFPMTVIVNASAADIGVSSEPCAVTIVEKEYVEIPDDVFNHYLVANFDTDRDGKISTSEAKKILAIDCRSKNISSLRGIEYFTSLTQLNCSGNKIAELDLNRNTALIDLNCSYNKLNTIDLSENTGLENLNCSHNSELGTLILGKNDALITLNCSNSLIFDIQNLNAQTKLVELNCSHNQLSELNLDDNTLLVEVDCSYNMLVSFDPGHNESMIHLICNNNEISALNVNWLSALKRLDCRENRLEGLSLNENIQLEELYCNKNNILESLDLTFNERLTNLNCGENARLSHIYVNLSQDEFDELIHNGSFEFDEYRVTVTGSDFVYSPDPGS